MTQATHEFINAINDRKNKELLEKIKFYEKIQSKFDKKIQSIKGRKILPTAATILTMTLTLWNVYIQFFPNNFNKITKFIFLVLSYIAVMFYALTKKFDYVRNVKYGLVKDILETMESKQLPLEIILPMIRKDIEERLAEIRHKIKTFETIAKNVFVGVTVLPIAFLFSEYFRNVFSGKEAKQIEFFEEMIKFMITLLSAGIIMVILALPAYFVLHKLLQYIMGENKNVEYLDVLHEIEISMECDKNAKEKIIY